MAISDLAAALHGLRITAFAGAGISHAAGFPLAAELTGRILDRLRMGLRSREALEARRLPFELFVETLAEISSADPLFEIYKGGSPCPFHQFCAGLARRRLLPAVVTTNFDLLFEQAFAAESAAFEQIWTEAALEGWTPGGSDVALLKIHGSAHDTQSLGITIRRVANQRGITAREAALRNAFTSPGTDLILVAGYSGSDRFDVSPILARLGGRERPFLLIAHSPAGGDPAPIAPLASHPRAGPFRGLRGALVECDTNSLLQVLTGAVAGSSALARARWEALVEDWLRLGRAQHGAAFPHLAKGALLRGAALPKVALPQFVKATEHATGTETRIEALLTQAKCKRDIGQWTSAVAISRTVLRRARRLGSERLQVQVLTELGVLSADLRHYERALRYYREAERIAWAIGSPHLAGVCIGNSAIIRKTLGGPRRWRRALADYQRALTIAQETGDKRSEGRTVGNIGVLHSKMGDSRKAVEGFRAAREIAASLGDTYHEAIWLANEGDQVWTSDPVRAVALVEDARQMFAALGSTARVRDCNDMLKRFAEGRPSEL